MQSIFALALKFGSVAYPDVDGDDFSCLFDKFCIGVFQVVFLHCTLYVLFVNAIVDVVFIKYSYVNHK